MPGPTKPLALQRCVRAVGKDKGINSAFAICTAALQKSGHLKPGTQRQTRKGAALSRRKAADPDASSKLKDYETMLANRRHQESLRGLVEAARGLLQERQEPDFREAHARMAALFEEWFEEEAYPPGTIRKWRTGSVIKTRDGEWVPYEVGSPHVTFKAPAVAGAEAGEDPMVGIDRLRQQGLLPADITPQQQQEIALEVLGLQQEQFPRTLEKLRQLASGDGAAVLGRIKEPESALGKLVRKPKNYKTARDLKDGSGFRVICGSIDDLRTSVSTIKAQYETSVADEEDYISKPKDGYRSYHLIIKDADGFYKEVQVRTPNEDTWANWSHDVYKPQSPQQREALERHADEILAYGQAMSDYYYAKDTGASPPAPPSCPPVIEKVFGCLPL